MGDGHLSAVDCNCAAAQRPPNGWCPRHGYIVRLSDANEIDTSRVEAEIVARAEVYGSNPKEALRETE